MSSSDTVNRMYIVPLFSSQREGRIPYERGRARLLDDVARLLEVMQADQSSLKSLILGGQTILLEDIGALRADLLALLGIFNAGGRLNVGPHYMSLDGALAHGETFIRNLLLGHQGARRLGLKPSRVVLLHEDELPQPAQLPQILRDFGVEAVLLMTNGQRAPQPFVWRSPNGSAVLVAHYVCRSTPSDALALQRLSQPDGPFLWLAQVEHAPQQAAELSLESVDGLPAQQGTLADYLAALRQALPDALRPVLRNDLLTQSDQRGRWSGRLHLKQASAALQNLLIGTVEPLLTLAMTHGHLPQPANRRALLDYAWRSLLQNQTPTALGTAIDAVEEDARLRQRRVQEVAYGLLEDAQQALFGSGQAAAESLYVVVWNSHNVPLSQIVGCDLRLPDGFYPSALHDPDGQDIPFAWDAPHIGFYAQAPALGYARYTVLLSRENLSSYAERRTERGRTISDGGMVTLSMEGGRLTWNGDGWSIGDLLSFDDGGDAGDLHRYHPPQQDVIVRASTVERVEVEATPIYERLTFHSRMRVAPSLEGDKRGRGLRVLELTTQATLYFQQSGLYLRTSFVNTARDHRLRVHLTSGKRSPKLTTDHAFGLSERLLSPGERLPLAIVPHSLCAARDEESTFLALTRGLNEMEIRSQDDQVVFSMTLARAVGWLDRKLGLSAPQAQAEQSFVVDYALMQLPQDVPAHGLYRLGQSYQKPLFAFQAGSSALARHSYLGCDEERLILQALKPPQEGQGWVMRLFNPTSEALAAHLVPTGKLTSAQRLTMAESHPQPLETTPSGLRLHVEPHQIITLRLEFAS
ncbi:MAG: hypothetical protein RML73_01215 [Anaerolineae bacterium]|nr:hypothetical protein [Anaerolineae bacterium]